MDKKKALKILDLDDSVSFEDAKKAYRNLAKKFHPDLRQKNPELQQHADDKMKSVNLAFCYLAPLLKQKTKSKKPQTTETEQQKTKEPEKHDNTFVSTIFSSFVKTFTKKQNSTGLKKNSVKKESVKASKYKKNNRFDDILKKANQNPEHGTKKRPETKHKNRFSNNYQKYIMQRKIIAARRSRANQDMSISKIEKIDPITRVNPIGRNQ